MTSLFQEEEYRAHEDAGRSRKLASAGATDHGSLLSSGSVVQGHPVAKRAATEQWCLGRSQKSLAVMKSKGLIHTRSPSNSSAPWNSATHSQSFFKSLHCSGFSSTPSLRASYGSNCKTRRNLATTCSCIFLVRFHGLIRHGNFKLSALCGIIQVAYHVEQMHLPKCLWMTPVCWLKTLGVLRIAASITLRTTFNGNQNDCNNRMEGKGDRIGLAASQNLL